MLNRFFSGVHRHTRAAKYADPRMQERARTHRPGAHGFAFTGEFPEMMDTQPVQATERRRNYTADHGPFGEYQTMGRMDTNRDRAVNKYGMRWGAALVSLFAVLMLLLGVTLTSVTQITDMTKQISAQKASISALQNESADRQADIARHSNDVAIRQEAVRLGLISSKGVPVIYLTVPETAIITPAAVSAQSVASIAGQ